MDALSRRAAIGGLAFGSLAVGWAVPVVAAPPEGQRTLVWKPRALAVDQALVLAAVAEAIMPATDTPGAMQAGVPQFIDRAIADWCEPEEAERIRKGLARIEADARRAHRKGFVALGPDARTALLRRYDAEATDAARRSPPQPHFFASLKELTTAGYFTSEVGATQTLRYDPVPGAYRGCVPLAEIGRAWAT